MECMRQTEGRSGSQQHMDVIRPYTDPGLKKNMKRFSAFIRSLLEIGLLGWCWQPEEVVGCFFVWKKCKVKRRLIVDARASNQHFKAPPSVALASVETLTRIEMMAASGHENDEEYLERVMREQQLFCSISISFLSGSCSGSCSFKKEISFFYLNITTTQQLP